MRCIHPDHDCTDLACSCICTRCIDDRLGIYAQAYPASETLRQRIRRLLSHHKK